LFTVERLSNRTQKLTFLKAPDVNYIYDVFILTKNEHRIKLIGGLEGPEFALFYEQTLESWLHIDDDFVPGELSRYL